MRVLRRGRDGKIEQLPNIDIPARTALFDRDGGLWIGGYTLSRVPVPEQVRNHKFKEASEKFTKTQGLTDDAVQAVLGDRQGNILVRTHRGPYRSRDRHGFWDSFAGGRIR